MPQPTPWSCLPAATAVVVGCKVEEIFSYLGHDGSEIWFPLEAEPYNHRCFHVQEIADYLYSRGKRLIEWEHHPASCSGDVSLLHPVFGPEHADARFKKRVAMGKGLLFMEDEGKRHVLAVTNKGIIDPFDDAIVTPNLDNSDVFYEIW